MNTITMGKTIRGDAITTLQRYISQWVALLFATRRRGTTVFGKPAVDISYDQALQEGDVVKRVNIKVREYGVDIQLEDKSTVYMTTQQIREEAGDQPIDKWETQRQLRYLTKYCSPILHHAITELNQLHLAAKATERPQMLIYAFSCHGMHKPSCISSKIKRSISRLIGLGPAMMAKRMNRTSARSTRLVIILRTEPSSNRTRSIFSSKSILRVKALTRNLSVSLLICP